jgi:hypothetical protein
VAVSAAFAMAVSAASFAAFSEASSAAVSEASAAAVSAASAAAVSAAFAAAVSAASAAAVSAAFARLSPRPPRAYIWSENHRENIKFISDDNGPLVFLRFIYAILSFLRNFSAPR